MATNKIRLMKSSRSFFQKVLFVDSESGYGTVPCAVYEWTNNNHSLNDINVYHNARLANMRWFGGVGGGGEGAIAVNPRLYLVCPVS